MQSFVKIKLLQNGEITLSFTNIGNSCPSQEFLASKLCLLTLIAKIKFSQKFPDLHYLFFGFLQLFFISRRDFLYSRELFRQFLHLQLGHLQALEVFGSSRYKNL